MRRQPALDGLFLEGNPLGDEALAALVAPPPQAGALPPPTGVLTKLKALYLNNTQITDAGCAAIVTARDRGALPALTALHLRDIPASDAAKAAACITRASGSGFLARRQAAIGSSRVIQ